MPKCAQVAENNCEVLSFDCGSRIVDLFHENYCFSLTNGKHS